MHQVTHVFVVAVHYVWMVLFIYGWLLIHAKPRFGALYAGIALSTILAWKIWGNCPITLLEDMLASPNAVSLIPYVSSDLVGSFVLVLFLSALYLWFAVKWFKCLPPGSLKHYLRTSGVTLLGMIGWITLIIYAYGFRTNFYIVANIAFGILVGILTVWAEFFQAKQKSESAA